MGGLWAKKAPTVDSAQRVALEGSQARAVRAGLGGDGGRVVMKATWVWLNPVKNDRLIFVTGLETKGGGTLNCVDNHGKFRDRGLSWSACDSFFLPVPRQCQILDIGPGRKEQYQLINTCRGTR